jgi:hypothetical protein
MKKIAIKLGLPETATEAEILAKISDLQPPDGNAETLQKEVAAQKQKAIEAEVNNGVTLGKFAADKRAHFIQLGKDAGIESLKTTIALISVRNCA